MRLLSQIAPPGMFRILDSKNQDIFAQAIVYIYEKMNSLPVLDKDMILNDLDSLVGSLSLDMDEDLGEETIPEESRARARIILNTLVSRGWLVEEVDQETFRTCLYVPSYAFPFMKAIQEVLDGKEHEYGSLIYRSYTSLHHASQNPQEEANLFDAVYSAYAASSELKRNLTEFFNSLHTYRLDLNNISESSEILTALVEEFREKAKREYAPVKTVDSYSRYKNLIIESVDEILGSDRLMKAASMQMVKKGKAETVGTAMDEVSKMLDAVSGTYEDLSQTMSLIEREYRIYVEKAGQRIRALYFRDQSIPGLLSQILKNLSELDPDRGQQVLQIMQSRLAAVPVSTANVELLYNPPVSSIVVQKPSRVVSDRKEMDEEQKKRIAMELKKDTIRKARIHDLLEAAVAEKEGRVTTQELPLTGVEDYKDIYAMIRFCTEDGQEDFEVTDVKSGEKLQKGHHIIPVLAIERTKGND